MADGPSTGHDDFLSQEIQESQTDESIKTSLLQDLRKAEEIKIKLGDNAEVKKEYDDVRIATIGALQNLRISTSENLDEVRRGLTGNINFSELSKGDISQEEHQIIQREFNDLKEIEIDSLNEEFSNILEKHNLFQRYGPLQALFGLPGVGTELLRSIILEIDTTGKLSLNTLRNTDSILKEYFSFDPLEEKETIQIVSDGLIEGDFQTINEAYISEDKKVGALRAVLEKDTSLIERVLFKYDIREYFNACGPDAIIFIDYLRAEYIESKDIVVVNNLSNYYKNQGISERKLDQLSQDLEGLAYNMKLGGCSIDYIAQIKDFNEQHGLDINFNSEDARNIIGSVIELRKTETELDLITLRDELSEITGKSFEEIQTIIDSGNPETIGNFLEEFNENSRIREMEGELFELLDIKREIQIQEERSENIIEGASAMYDALYQPSIEQILRRPQDIGMIQDKDILLEIFDGEHKEQLRDKIELKYIPLEFLYERDIVLKFPGKIGVNEVRLLPDSILNQSDIIIHFIGQSIKYNDGIAIRDFLYSYSSAYGTDLHDLVYGIHELMQTLSPEDADHLRDNIPRAILRASNSDILGVPEQNFEFQDELYYLNLATNLNHQRGMGDGLDGAGDRATILEIDRYLEYGRNSQEIIKLFCNKGLLGYTNYAKHQIGKNPVLWKEIIDNGEITDIRYVNAQTRAYHGFQEHLLSVPRFTSWQQRTSIQDYITLNSIDDTMRWFDFLSNLDGAPAIQGVIEAHPEILFSTQQALKNKTFINPDSREQEQEAIDFIVKISSNSGDYINANKIREPLSEAGFNMKKAQLNNIGEYKNVLGSIFESYQLSDERISQVLGILEDNNMQNIVGSAKKLKEIFGNEEHVTKFLVEVSSHLEKYLDNDTDIQIERLNQLGSHEQNSDLYDSLLLDGVFQKDVFLSTLSKYGNTKGIPMKDGESHTEYGLRIQTIYLNDLNLSDSQKELVLKVLSNELRAEEIIIFRADPETFVKLSIENDGDTSLFTKRIEMRRAAGITHRTQGERSGEEIFNYKTGSLEVNPNYNSLGNEGSTPSDTSQDQSDSFNTGDAWLNKSAEGRSIVNYGGETKLIVDNNTQIPITKEDAAAIQNNPEAEGNLIKTYTMLKKLNLEEFWDYKEYIFTTIQNKSVNSGLDISDGNYLNENEMSLFLYTIADSVSSFVGTEEQAEIESYKGSKQDLNKTYQLLLRLNKQDGVMTNQEDVSMIRGESRIGQIFRREFLGQENNKDEQSIAGFQWGKFNDSID